MPNNHKENIDILLVEDDPGIGAFLQSAMDREPGYCLHWERTLRDAWKAYEKYQLQQGHCFALLLLDLGLPDGDGQSMIRRLRTQSGEQPLIVVISARGHEMDKVQALDEGADDYLTKPFTIGELFARLRAHLRKKPVGVLEDNPRCWVIGELEIDDPTHCVRKKGKVIDLTPKEYELLHLLAINQGRVLSYRIILTSIWGIHSMEQKHYVRLYIKRLREKIEDDPEAPQYLLTEKGFGYRLVDQ
ncbi:MULTISPECIES: response regulator transcription factor [Acidithiobacillus]|uniref:response regulator transcription factor n=1 Tax=Acidithiobacillus TaxID=119977 RepID=UPI00094B3DF8|nr:MULTISPECIES: response regulator transcription factor [Acidithiobacillus]MBU2792209.1 response regulator transcription factor [Acidithiobacillus thiooxidans]